VANARTEQRDSAATGQSTGSANGGSQTAHPSTTSRLSEDHAAQKAASAPGVTTPIPALPGQQPAAPPPATTVPIPATSPLPLPPPVRLVFEEGKTELTPADEAAIQDLARAIPAPAADSINVVAYAAGKADDPSTARRLSLSRGLAVRSVLLASGVPSAQIYVRALGSTPSNGPADRVELIVAPIGTVVTQ
jgi:outer membrane protein OmpA-like peptidoglycan-associated protein